MQTVGSLLGDRRKYPCGIRGMSLKTSLQSLSKKFSFRESFRPPSGNEFKNTIVILIPSGKPHIGFRPPTSVAKCLLGSGNEFKNP